MEKIEVNMGHAHIRNLNDILIKRIFAKGKASIKECINYCIVHKIPLHASECDYFDGYMLSMGFEEVVLFHAHPWNENKHRPTIEPIAETEEQKKIIEHFNKDGLSGLEEYNIKTEKFDEIQWKFTKGSRTMYLQKKLSYVENFEN